MAQSDDDPLRQLRVAHPRLILPDADLDRVRALVRDNAVAKRIYNDLEKECDRLLTTPVSEYKLVGPRLRAVARRILDRVGTLAIMYRLTLKEPYLRRAVQELRAAAAFRDWNPALFADTADMAHAFALGYDWLYNALSTDERGWMRDAVAAKAFDPAIPIYQRDAAWPRDHYNANMSSNAGLGLAALAVAGDKINDSDQAVTDKCGTVLRYVLESLPHGLATYGVEGSWPEGMAYWETVTRDVSAFFSGLQTALGNDYGLSSFHGVDRAGRFRIHMTGPLGKVFNFGDAPEDIGLSPEMFWMAMTLGGRRRKDGVEGDTSRLARVAEGIRFVRERPVVLGAISLDLFAVLLGGATALLPVYARDILLAGPIGLGLLRSAPALGAALMALTLARWPIERGTGAKMFGAVAVFGLSTIVFGLSHNFLLSLVALCVLGASDMISVFVRSALINYATPDHMRGRVGSVSMLFIGASNELGEFKSGLTAAWFGTVPSVVIGGLGTLAIVAIWMKLFPPLRTVDRLRDVQAT